MELYLVRHIEPFAVKGMCYGQKDVELPSDFVDLHEKVIKLLPDNLDRVYSSPLSRCKILAKALSPEIVIDNRLMEINFGAWEGHKWDNINRGDLDQWASNYVDQPPPGGESLREVANRLAAFIQDIRSEDLCKIALITHAGIIRCALHYLLAVPLHEVMQHEVAYGSIHKFKL